MFRFPCFAGEQLSFNNFDDWTEVFLIDLRVVNTTFYWRTFLLTTIAVNLFWLFRLSGGERGNSS